MEKKEFIILGVCMVLIYLAVTVSEVIVIKRSFEVENNVIRQEIEECSHVNDSIR